MRQTLSQSRSVREREGWVNGCSQGIGRLQPYADSLAALDFGTTIKPKACARNTPTPQPFSAGAELNSNGLLLRRWLRSSRGVAPKKLR